MTIEEILNKIKNNEASSLDLGYQDMRAEGIKAIAPALTDNTCLVSIDLSGNKIDEEGSKAIPRILTANTTLTSIDLNNNGIGNNGAKVIAEALIVNTTLRSINLSINKIDDEGVEAIASALKINANITSIDLGINRIGDKGIQKLASALIANTILKLINLTCNIIGAEGAKILASLLIVNKTLISIDLNGNKIGDEGAITIASALLTNSTLTSIDLGGNRIGDIGAKAIRDLLAVNTTLTSLNLEGFKISDEHLLKIRKRLRRNRFLANLETKLAREMQDHRYIHPAFKVKCNKYVDRLIKFQKSNPNVILSTKLEETYRLARGIINLSGELKKAWPDLTKRFTATEKQQLADNELAYKLMAEEPPKKLSSSYYRYALWLFRHELKHPEKQMMIAAIIAHLKGEKSDDFAKLNLKTQLGTNKIITYDELWDLGKRLLAEYQTNNVQDSHRNRIGYLQSLLKHKQYEPTSSMHLLNVLTEIGLIKEKIALLEQVLMTPKKVFIPNNEKRIALTEERAAAKLKVWKKTAYPREVDFIGETTKKDKQAIEEQLIQPQQHYAGMPGLLFSTNTSIPQVIHTCLLKKKRY